MNSQAKSPKSHHQQLLVVSSRAQFNVLRITGTRQMRGVLELSHMQAWMYALDKSVHFEGGQDFSGSQASPKFLKMVPNELQWSTDLVEKLVTAKFSTKSSFCRAKNHKY